MKKGIIIIGPNAALKTKKANEIASQFPKESVLWLYSEDKKDYLKRFLFSKSTKKTQLIIFEGIKEANDLGFFFKFIPEGVYINKRGKSPFIINPKILLVCQSEIKAEQLVELGESFNRRFDLLEC